MLGALEITKFFVLSGNDLDWNEEDLFNDSKNVKKIDGHVQTGCPGGVGGANSEG